MATEKKMSDMTPEEIKAEIRSINKTIVQQKPGGCRGPTEESEPQPSQENCCESNEAGDG